MAKITKTALLAQATQLGIVDCDVMSAKALKRAISEATAATPPPAPPAVAPAAEAPSAKAPAKPARLPLTSAQFADRLAKAQATIGQIEGAPQTGGDWHSPHGKGHKVLGTFYRDGKLYVRTVRLSDGREFEAQTKRVVRDIKNQTGVNGATILATA